MTFEADIAREYRARRERLWPSKRTLRPAPKVVAEAQLFTTRERRDRPIVWSEPKVYELKYDRAARWRPAMAAVTLECLRTAVERIMTDKPTVARIQREVATAFNFDHVMLLARCRRKAESRARLYAMALCRNLTDWSLGRIGHEFARDHSCVHNAMVNHGRLISSLTGVPMPPPIYDPTKRRPKK
jgi:hypothetical protein